MLILTRRVGERINIGEDITVTVLGMDHRAIRLGITAPEHIAVHREEIYNRIKAQERIEDGRYPSPVQHDDDTDAY